MGAPFKLKPKHKMAVDEYMTNGHQKVEAMRSAGYSESTAVKRVDLVFSREDVQNEIARRMQKLQHKASQEYDLNESWILKRMMDLADAPRVLARFKKIAPDGSLYWDFTGACEDELALVHELTTEVYMEGRGPGAEKVKKFKVKMPDQHAALAALMRHLGMFNDKLEVTESSLTDRIQAGRDRISKDKDDETVH